MCGTTRPAAEQRDELGLVAVHLVGRVHGEVEELEAEHVHALEQHEVERDARDRARRVADGDEAATPVQRAQRRLGEVAADGIDDDVAAVGKAVAQRLAQVRPSDGR